MLTLEIENVYRDAESFAQLFYIFANKINCQYFYLIHHHCFGMTDFQRYFLLDQDFFSFCKVLFAPLEQMLPSQGCMIFHCEPDYAFGYCVAHSEMLTLNFGRNCLAGK